MYYPFSENSALISCAVTAQLIYVFVFAYAKSRFSHNEAHMIKLVFMGVYIISSPEPKAHR